MTTFVAGIPNVLYQYGRSYSMTIVFSICDSDSAIPFYRILFTDKNVEGIGHYIMPHIYHERKIGKDKIKELHEIAKNEIRRKREIYTNKKKK